MWSRDLDAVEAELDAIDEWEEACRKDEEKLKSGKKTKPMAARKRGAARGGRGGRGGKDDAGDEDEEEEDEADDAPPPPPKKAKVISWPGSKRDKMLGRRRLQPTFLWIWMTTLPRRRKPNRSEHNVPDGLQTLRRDRCRCVVGDKCAHLQFAEICWALRWPCEWGPQQRWRRLEAAVGG